MSSNDECVITEIRRDGRWLILKWGDGRDFIDKLNQVKVAFQHGTEREYDPVNKEWRVIFSDETVEKLTEIFPNGEASVSAAKAQLSLF